jgi:hypothetical protein
MTAAERVSWLERIRRTLRSWAKGRQQPSPNTEARFSVADGYNPVLSPKAEADLKAGLESAKLGNYAYGCHKS